MTTRQEVLESVLALGRRFDEGEEVRPTYILVPAWYARLLRHINGKPINIHLRRKGVRGRKQAFYASHRP
jgi:hypothetical protein